MDSPYFHPLSLPRLWLRMQRVSSMASNAFVSKKIVYVAEGGGWCTDEIGAKLCSYLPSSQFRLSYSAKLLTNCTIHFATLNSFLYHANTIDESNRTIVTCYHLDPHLSLKDALLANKNKIDLLHTSCTISKDTLCDLGFSKENIKIIPLGIDCGRYSLPTSAQKISLRKSLGIPQNAWVIGSFQKDGNHWGPNASPKLIKGPDIFCDVLGALREKYPVFALLSGPSRDFVTSRLEYLGVPFLHFCYSQAKDVAQLYHACDMYLVASRLEGGPLATFEAPCSGVPIVTTRVGLVPDVLTHEKTALICDSEDREGLRSACERLICDEALRNTLIRNGLQWVKAYDWEYLSQRYWQELYCKKPEAAFA